jgi:hypothetical protein
MKHAESSAGPRPSLLRADADDSDIAELARWLLGTEPTDGQVDVLVAKSKILAPGPADLDAWQPANWVGEESAAVPGAALAVVSVLKGMRQASTEAALADPSPCAHRRHPRPGADPHS